MLRYMTSLVMICAFPVMSMGVNKVAFSNQNPYECISEMKHVLYDCRDRLYAVKDRSMHAQHAYDVFNHHVMHVEAGLDELVWAADLNDINSHINMRSHEYFQHALRCAGAAHVAAERAGAFPENTIMSLFEGDENNWVWDVAYMLDNLRWVEAFLEPDHIEVMKQQARGNLLQHIEQARSKAQSHVDKASYLFKKDVHSVNFSSSQPVLHQYLDNVYCNITPRHIDAYNEAMDATSKVATLLACKSLHGGEIQIDIRPITRAAPVQGGACSIL